jgi:hypothetical protein
MIAVHDALPQLGDVRQSKLVVSVDKNFCTHCRSRKNCSPIPGSGHLIENEREVEFLQSVSNFIGCHRVETGRHGVHRVITEVVGRNSMRKKPLYPDGSGRRFKLRLAITRNARLFRRPPSSWIKFIEEGKHLQSSCNTYRNLLVCGRCNRPFGSKSLRSAPSLFRCVLTEHPGLCLVHHSTRLSCGL